MKRTISISIAAVMIALLVVVGTRSVFSQRGNENDDHGDVRWEYLVVQGGNVNLTPSDGGSMRKADGAFSRETFPLEKNMDKLGAKGWELVSVSESRGDPIFYFKRRR